MENQQIIEALSDCVKRIQQGETTEECLSDYPELADELRVLLAASALPTRAEPDAPELFAMRSRMDTYVDRLIDNTTFPDAPPRRSSPWTLLLVAILFIAITTTLSVLSRPQDTVIDITTPTVGYTATVMATVTQTPVTATATTSTPSLTITPISTQDEPATASACVPQRPDGWEIYRIRSGDSLSLIAVSSGTTIEAILEPNCLERSSIILPNQEIFVPMLWDTSAPATNTGNVDGNPSNPNPPPSDDDDSDDSDDSDDDDDDD